MTPLHINIMLHYYCRVEPYAQNEPEHRYSSATIEYTRELVAKNLLKPSQCPNVYVPTEKGRAYVEALKSIAEPVQKCIWVQPGDS